MTFVDWVRIVNVTLACVTVVSMWLVTWRLYPSMEWFEVVAREGVTLAFAVIAFGSIETITQQVGYGVRVWGMTIALSVSAIGFTVWATHLPKRRPDWAGIREFWGEVLHPSRKARRIMREKRERI